MAPLLPRLLGEDSDEEDAGTQQLVFFLALIVGVLCRVLLRRVKLPYMVMLLVFGILVGALYNEDTSNNTTTMPAQLRRSVKQWLEISPHTLLFSFLPVLVFEAGFAADAHIFLREIGQVLLLAVPGFIFCTMLTAAFAWVAFPYGWGWHTCFLLASILNTTDPSAAVAVMKELGAGGHLSLLMEGEALLKDGMVLVFFSLFQDSVAGEDHNGMSGAVVTTLRLVCGGPIVGAFVSHIAVFALNRVYNDAVAEITITVIAAFSAFTLAEGSGLGGSGVLAVVVVGLYMSYFGKTRLSSTVEHELHSFWSVMHYVANTVIFFLSGLIVMDKGILGSSVSAVDWACLFGLYLFLHLARALMVALCFPILRKWGYGLSRKEAVLLSYAGMRGAIGLTLALIVAENDDIEHKKGDLILFHMSGISMLTLVINGSFMDSVVRMLHMDRASNESQEVFRTACDQLDVATHDVVDSLCTNDRHLRDADFSAVWQYVGLHTQDVFLDRVKLVAHNGTKIAPRLHNRWRYYLETFQLPARLRRDPKVRKVFAPSLKTTFYQQLCNAWHGIKNAAHSLGTSVSRQLSRPSGGNASMLGAALLSGGNGAGAELGETTGVGSGMEAGDNSEVQRNRRERMLDKHLLLPGMEHEARRRFVMALQSTFWRQLDDGYVRGSALWVLVESTNMALDNLHQPLNHWNFVERILSFSVEDWIATPWMRKLLSKPFIGFFLRATVHIRLTFAFNVVSNFIRAHEYIVSRADTDKLIMLHADVRSMMRREILRNMHAAELWLAKHFDAFPEIVRSIKTRAAVHIVLAEERKLIRDLQRRGRLDDIESNRLLHLNTESQIMLAGHPIFLSTPTKGALLSELDFLQDLPEHVFAQVCAVGAETFIKPGEIVYREGDIPNGWYLISRGTCAVYSKLTHEGGQTLEQQLGLDRESILENRDSLRLSADTSLIGSGGSGVAGQIALAGAVADAAAARSRGHGACGRRHRQSESSSSSSSPSAVGGAITTSSSRSGPASHRHRPQPRRHRHHHHHHQQQQQQQQHHDHRHLHHPATANLHDPEKLQHLQQAYEHARPDLEEPLLVSDDDDTLPHTRPPGIPEDRAVEADLPLHRSPIDVEAAAAEDRQNGGKTEEIDEDDDEVFFAIPPTGQAPQSSGYPAAQEETGFVQVAADESGDDEGSASPTLTHRSHLTGYEEDEEDGDEDDDDDEDGETSLYGKLMQMIGPGTCVGVLASLSERLHRKTVVAKSLTQLHFFDRMAMARLMQTYRPLREQVYRYLPFHSNYTQIPELVNLSRVQMRGVLKSARVIFVKDALSESSSSASVSSSSSSTPPSHGSGSTESSPGLAQPRSTPIVQPAIGAANPDGSAIRCSIRRLHRRVHHHVNRHVNHVQDHVHGVPAVEDSEPFQLVHLENLAPGVYFLVHGDCHHHDGKVIAAISILYIAPAKDSGNLNLAAGSQARRAAADNVRDNDGDWTVVKRSGNSRLITAQVQDEHKNEHHHHHHLQQQSQNGALSNGVDGGTQDGVGPAVVAGGPPLLRVAHGDADASLNAGYSSSDEEPNHAVDDTAPAQKSGAPLEGQARAKAGQGRSRRPRRRTTAAGGDEDGHTHSDDDDEEEQSRRRQQRRQLGFGMLHVLPGSVPIEEYWTHRLQATDMLLTPDAVLLRLADEAVSTIVQSFAAPPPSWADAENRSAQDDLAAALAKPALVAQSSAAPVSLLDHTVDDQLKGQCIFTTMPSSSTAPASSSAAALPPHPVLTHTSSANTSPSGSGRQGPQGASKRAVASARRKERRAQQTTSKARHARKPKHQAGDAEQHAPAPTPEPATAPAPASVAAPPST